MCSFSVPCWSNCGRIKCWYILLHLVQNLKHWLNWLYVKHLQMHSSVLSSKYLLLNILQMRFLLAGSELISCLLFLMLSSWIVRLFPTRPGNLCLICYASIASYPFFPLPFEQSVEALETCLFTDDQGPLGRGSLLFKRSDLLPGCGVRAVHFWSSLMGVDSYSQAIKEHRAVADVGLLIGPNLLRGGDLIRILFIEPHRDMAFSKGPLYYSALVR